MEERIRALIHAGWHLKLMTDHDSANGPAWRCWISWRRPHKEESVRADSLELAVQWMETTAANWHHD